MSTDCLLAHRLLLGARAPFCQPPSRLALPALSPAVCCLACRLPTHLACSLSHCLLARPLSACSPTACFLPIGVISRPSPPVLRLLSAVCRSSPLCLCTHSPTTRLLAARSPPYPHTYPLLDCPPAHLIAVALRLKESSSAKDRHHACPALPCYLPAAPAWALLLSLSLPSLSVPLLLCLTLSSPHARLTVSCVLLQYSARPCSAFTLLYNTLPLTHPPALRPPPSPSTAADKVPDRIPPPSLPCIGPARVDTAQSALDPEPLLPLCFSATYTPPPGAPAIILIRLPSPSPSHPFPIRSPTILLARTGHLPPAGTHPVVVHSTSLPRPPPHCVLSLPARHTC